MTTIVLKKGYSLINKVLEFDYLTGRKLFLALTFALIFLVILYGFFIGQIVFNGSKIKTIERKGLELSSHLSSVEVRYLNLKNKIDIEFAESLGFREIKNPRFVSRKPSENKLTLKN